MLKFLLLCLKLVGIILDRISLRYTPLKWLSGKVIKSFWLEGFEAHYEREMGVFFTWKDRVFLKTFSLAVTFIFFSSVLWLRSTYFPTDREKYDEKCKLYQQSLQLQESFERSKAEQERLQEIRAARKAGRAPDIAPGYSTEEIPERTPAQKFEDKYRPDAKDSCGDPLFPPNEFDENGKLRTPSDIVRRSILGDSDSASEKGSRSP